MTLPPKHSQFTRSTQATTSHTTSRVMVRSRHLLQRVRVVLSRVGVAFRDGVSAQGWFVVAVAVIAGVLGMLWGWNEFVIAAVFATVLALTALPFLVGSRRHVVQVQLAQSRIVVGESAELAVHVTNAGRSVSLPGSIDVPVGEGILECHTPVLAAGAEFTETFAIPGAQRGVLAVGPARSVRSDPLDLFRRERVWREKFSLMVHPQTTRIPSTTSGFIRDLEGRASTKLVTDDLSFHAIREYQPGDSRKQVHWKSTAKTGTLMVRQYEETRRSDISLMLATNAEEFRDPEEFELAVSVAASVGVRGLLDGRTVQCIIADPTPSLASGTTQHTVTLPSTTPQLLLDGFTRVTQHPTGLAFDQLAQLIAYDTGAASIVFLVGGSGLTVQQMRRAALMFPPNLALVVLRCDTHAEPDMWTVSGVPVLSVALLDDLPHLLMRGRNA